MSATTPAIPTPAILAGPRRQHIDPAKLERWIEAACRKKNRYDTEAAAQDKGMRRMLIGADSPLYVYPCEYCFGWHLTSSDKGRDSKPVVPLVDGADPELMAKGCGSERPVPGGHRRRRRKVESETPIPRVVEERLDRLPTPSPASSEEVDAFFRDAAPRPARVVPLHSPREKTNETKRDGAMPHTYPA